MHQIQYKRKLKKKKSKYIRLTENSSSCRKSNTWKIHVSKSTQRNDSMENRGRFTVRNAVQSNFRESESKTIFGSLPGTVLLSLPGDYLFRFFPLYRTVCKCYPSRNLRFILVHYLRVIYQLASLCFCNKFLIKEQIGINNIS